MRSRITRGESPLPPPTTARDQSFRRFSATWFDTYVRPNNKPSEQRGKESTLRLHLLPTFGRLSLGAITPEMIEHYKAIKRASGLSAKTINNQLGILGKCLRTAVEWGHLKAVPPYKPLKAPPPSFDFLSPEEARRLVQHGRGNWWGDMMLLALHTGLRRGELMALDWSDVDLDRNVLTVRRSLLRGVFGSPKSNRVRHVPLSNIVRKMLEGRRTSRGLVFAQETGEPIASITMDRVIARTCKAAGLRHVSWHVLRHTFASHLAAAGVPVPAIQQLLGHSSITMTMRYAHLSPSFLRQAIAVLDAREETNSAKFGQPVGNRDHLGVIVAPGEASHYPYDAAQQSEKPAVSWSSFPGGEGGIRTVSNEV